MLCIQLFANINYCLPTCVLSRSPSQDQREKIMREPVTRFVSRAEKYLDPEPSSRPASRVALIGCGRLVYLVLRGSAKPCRNPLRTLAGNFSSSLTQTVKVGGRYGKGSGIHSHRGQVVQCFVWTHGVVLLNISTDSPAKHSW